MLKLLSVHWGLSLGGVAKYAATLERVRGLMQIDLRSLCILPAGRVVDQDVLAALDAVVIPVRSSGDVRWIGEVRRAIARELPDCVMSHGFNGHLAVLLGTAFGAKRPRKLASYHGSYHATTAARRLVEPVYNGFTHWYLRRRADAILNVAEYCADFLHGKGVPREKLAVVHNGIPDLAIDPDHRARLRDEWGLTAGLVAVGVASRLDPVKGLNHLLDAFARVRKSRQDTRLILIGDGTERQSLEDQARRLGIGDAVRFVGMRSDVPACLTALDVFALPSLAEYHSIGLLEAMRAGLAIAATDVGGNTESVRDGKEGLIVPPADAEALAAALQALIGDAAARARFGAAARARFSAEFTEDAMLRKTANWLTSNCGG